MNLTPSRFERLLKATRRPLAPNPPGPDASFRERWWESKLGILLIGFVLTGALAPWLQYIQKGLEWKRQVRFEAYTNRLNAMRECLKEVTQIYVMAEELREQTARAEPRSRLSGVVKEQAALAELRTQRIRQIAKIAGLIGYFPNSGTLVRRFEETATLLDTLARQTGEYLSVEARGDAPHPPDHGAIADTVTALRAHYRTLKNTMQEQVGRLEDEQDKIFF